MVIIARFLATGRHQEKYSKGKSFQMTGKRFFRNKKDYAEFLLVNYVFLFLCCLSAVRQLMR